MKTSVLNHKIETQTTHTLSIANKKAVIEVKDQYFQRVHVTGIDSTWSYDDWEFLGAVSTVLRKMKDSGDMKVEIKDFDDFEVISTCDI